MYWTYKCPVSINWYIIIKKYFKIFISLRFIYELFLTQIILDKNTTKNKDIKLIFLFLFLMFK